MLCKFTLAATLWSELEGVRVGQETREVLVMRPGALCCGCLGNRVSAVETEPRRILDGLWR